MKDFEVLGAKMNFYQLANGLVLYSDEVVSEGDFLVFDMRNTVVLTPAVGPHGEQGITAQKGTNCPAAVFSSRMEVRKDAVLVRHDTVNERLMLNIRQELSGIQIVKPGR